MDVWMVTHVKESKEGTKYDAILVCPAKDTANYYGMTNTFTPCLCRLYDGEVRLKQKLWNGGMIHGTLMVQVIPDGDLPAHVSE